MKEDGWGRWGEREGGEGLRMLDEGVGVRRRGERLSVKEERRGGGSELGTDLDLDPDPAKLQILLKF